MKARPGDKQFTVRINEALYERLKSLAAMERRSINGQVEYLIVQAVTHDSPSR